MKVIILADKLKKAMLREGYNISALALEVKVGVSYMSQIFNGKRNPSPKLAKRIADTLGVEIEEIFTIEVKKEAN